VLSIGSALVSMVVFSSVPARREQVDEPAVTGSIQRSGTGESFERFLHDRDRRAELVSQGFKPIKKAPR
jgi:hypothetical protein